MKKRAVNRGVVQISPQTLIEKYKAVGAKEKAKLTAKLILRVAGIKKPLFLGGYSAELREKQAKDDRILADRLLESREQLQATFDAGQLQNSARSADSEIPCADQPEVFAKQCEGSYLAVAVDSLDKGGLERVAALLISEWVRMGIPVKVFCIKSGGRIAGELCEKKVEVLEFGGSEEKLRTYLCENRPCLVNTHFLQTGMAVFYELKIPVVEVIHNMYVFMDLGTIQKERAKQVYVDHYIAVSQRAAEVFVRKAPEISMDRLTVIGNRFDVKAKTANDRQKVRKELGIDEDTFVFLAVGAVDSRKNLLGMIRGISVLRELTDRKVLLLYAGNETDPEYAGMVRRLIAERGLSEVLLLGQRNDVPDLLGASDAFLMDSYCEGWSVAATEALCFGIPIIHSDCGSGRELTFDTGNGILIGNPIRDIDDLDGIRLWDLMHAGINDNLEELVKAMLNLMEREEAWKSTKESRIAYAKENFSTKKTAQQYLQVFSEILAKHIETQE